MGNRKILAFAALAVVAVLSLIVLALPPLLKHLAIKKIDETTGRKCQIANVALNPFKLTAELSGVRLSERGSSAAFFSLSSARLALSPLSLPKRSFIINQLHVVSPYLHVVRDAPNHYNFSDLVTPKKGEKKEGTPLFSINNIIIERGSVDFQDKALRAERYHQVRGMEISIPFVTNMPYLANRYVTPRFSAVVNGSPWRFDGRLKPLTRAVEATLSLNIRELDLPFYLGYLPFPLPVKVTSGRLATALDVGYWVDEKTGPELRVSGDAALDQVDVKEPGGAPLVALDRARLGIRNAALLARKVEVSSLELNGMDLTATRERSGKWNFQRMLANPPSPPPVKGGATSRTPSAKGGESPAPGGKGGAAKEIDLKLAKLSLSGGRIHLSDRVPEGGFKTDVKEIEMTLHDFSLTQGHKAPLALKCRTARGETMELKGELAIKPREFRGTLAITGLPLKDYYPYLADTLTAPVSGILALSSGLSYSYKDGIVLDKAVLKGRSVDVPFGSGDGWRVKEAVLSGLGLDLKRRRAAAERIDLKGGRLSVSSTKGGGFSYERLLKTKQKTHPKRGGARKEEAAPFSYRVARMTGSNLGIRFTDRTSEESPVFTLSGLNFSLSGITGPKQGTIPFTLTSRYGGQGRIRADGRFTPQPLKFKGNVQLHGIPLRDFDAYMPKDTTVFIAEGALDTTMRLDIEKAGSDYRGSFAGSLGVRSFYCQDTNLDEDLLKWESLQMERLSGTLAPFSLAVREVTLGNFYSRVIVNKDGTLNLQHLREEPAPVQPTAAGAPVRPAQRIQAPAQTKLPAAGETPAQPYPIRIDTITMQGGTMAFSDRHLQTPFDTTFYNLGGRVSGLSSEASRLADVDLRGNLENHSPLTIKGVINPLRGDLYLDMKIAFSDIELSPLSPYATTYVGYTVDKGKLSLDLVYRIDKKALSSQNKVFIDQFTFGKEVESPKATKLPVRLAVALLKDRKGEIHLELPVTGRTDDPQFSVWKVVWQILKNLLVKAATSPLALLGSMFGGDGEDFSAVAFAPGSDRLARPEQEKLAKLSKALQDRPALKLEISGFVEREADAEGYRNEVLLKKMKGEKFRKVVKEGKARAGQTADETEILPEEYPAYLKAVYVKEKFPKPRNMLGMLKDLPEAEMRKLILTHTVVGNDELQALARERAERVKSYLMTEGKIPPERLFEKSSDIYKPAAKGGAGSRVEFGVGAR